MTLPPPARLTFPVWPACGAGHRVWYGRWSFCLVSCPRQDPCGSTVPQPLCAHRRYGSYAVSDSARTHPYWLRSLRLWQLADVLYCLRRGLSVKHGQIYLRPAGAGVDRCPSKWSQPETASHSEAVFRDTVSAWNAIRKAHPVLSRRLGYAKCPDVTPRTHPRAAAATPCGQGRRHIR